ncbi:MAG: ornithine cyclodeaminase family protein [Planctomycetia bacterium]|nr:ornithine cyclodeaminase family protein [Planctomycetia bacterium]
MPALFLTEDNVRELLDMPAAIEVVENLFRQLADGRVKNVPRARVIGGKMMLHTMSGVCEYLNIGGWKAYTTTRDKARFLVGLYDLATGETLAIIEADTLGQLRTGAASGVATEFLARPDAKVVGLFGAGLQARTQLKAVCSVRHIERVEVYCRDAARRESFAAEMSEYCATRVVPAHTPDDAAAEKDIVICATTSKTPLFDGRVLDEGTHLNVVGSNFLSKAEVDVTTIQRSVRIICDSVEQCRLEAGDFIPAIEAGVTDWSLMHELAGIVSGHQTGRALPEDITLFKSVGLAIEDVALGAKLLQLAKDANLGQPLPF